MNTALFQFDHMAFVLSRSNLDLAVSFFKEVIDAPLTRAEDFQKEGWGLRFNNLGSHQVSIQRNWETEADQIKPHIGFKVSDLIQAFKTINEWCDRYNQPHPSIVWMSEHKDKMIISLAFLPYNIEMMLS